MKLKTKRERIERYCLKCERPFLADGRFNRICAGCTKTNEKAIRETYIPGRYCFAGGKFPEAENEA